MPETASGLSIFTESMIIIVHDFIGHMVKATLAGFLLKSCFCTIYQHQLHIFTCVQKSCNNNITSGATFRFLHLHKFKADKIANHSVE